MPTTVAAYLRVSTAKQDTSSQRAEIERWLKANGISDSETTWYIDKGVSGSKTSRPEWDRLDAALESGLHKTVVCYSLDRVGRWENTDLFTIWRLKMRTLGVEIIAIDGRGVAYESFSDKLIALIEAEMRSQERVKTIERTRAAVRAFRSRDPRWGGQRLPIGSKGGPKLTDEQRGKIVRLHEKDGVSYKKIAVEFGVSVRTVVKIVARGLASRRTESQ